MGPSAMCKRQRVRVQVVPLQVCPAQVQVCLHCWWQWEFARCSSTELSELCINCGTIRCLGCVHSLFTRVPASSTMWIRVQMLSVAYSNLIRRVNFATDHAGSSSLQ